VNLLVALDAMLREGSVTRAAARLGVTQSAMSHALRQLRELLGDPLLVRGTGGMVLTPRAESLAVPLRRGLEDLKLALRDEPLFDPAAARRAFTIATNDAVGLLILPPLLDLFGREAPGIDLDVTPGDMPRYAHQLETGALDLALGAAFDAAPGIRTRTLMAEQFACLVRADHPEVKETLDLATYVRLPHVLISPRGEGQGFVDAALEPLGLRRRIALRIRYFLLAPIVVARSSLVLTAPRRISEILAEAFPLRVLRPPLELSDFTIVMAWHERFDNDPAQRWLRRSVVRAVETFTAGERDAHPMDFP
jgi:DNA-binding transcriptional LysR family regulator